MGESLVIYSSYSIICIAMVMTGDPPWFQKIPVVDFNRKGYTFRWYVRNIQKLCQNGVSGSGGDHSKKVILISFLDENCDSDNCDSFLCAIRLKLFWAKQHQQIDERATNNHCHVLPIFAFVPAIAAFLREGLV